MPSLSFPRLIRLLLIAQSELLDLSPVGSVSAPKF